MEGLSPLHRRVTGVAGIDVHRMLHVGTALVENDDETIDKHQREFGGFKRDMKAMAAWLPELKVTLAVLARFRLVRGSESAGKRKTGKTHKGNAIIRYILCECANAARMTKSSLSSEYHNLKVRKSHKKCIVSIAHKLIRITCFMLSRREPYRDPGVNYEAMSAKKNAPRWIKALKKLGKLPTAKPA